MANLALNGYQESSERREHRLALKMISHFDLDLSGLTVLTEAASGPYLSTPLLAAEAGAEVLAVTADSSWGTGSDIKRETLERAISWGVGDSLQVSVGSKPRSWLAKADLVTNSGHLRPITARDISLLKPTCVIPLMWETWEYRESDLDLGACRSAGILVLGTNESKDPCTMSGYSAALALKLLFALGLEVNKTRVLVLGSQDLLAGAIADRLPLVGAEVRRFTCNGGKSSDKFADLNRYFAQNGREIDAILVAEHESGDTLIGVDAYLTPQTIVDVNPDVAIGVISGGVEASSLLERGIQILPTELQGPGVMSYQASALGPRPVLELYAAGLRVGQDMARARLAGASPRQAAEAAIANGPAMDFPGPAAWS